MKTVLVLTLLVIGAASLWSQQLSLAILHVDPVGVDPEIAALTEDSIQTEFMKLAQFQTQERRGFDEALAGLGLQLSGITDSDLAARAGEALGVQKVVFGTISKYDSVYVQFVLSLRLVDVEKATVDAAETLQIRSKADIPTATAEIASRLSSRVQTVGKITRIDVGTLYTSLGEASGVGQGDILSIVQIVLTKDKSGKVLLREENPVANLVVESASPEGSRCRVQEKAADLLVGMSVRKGTVTIEQQTASGLSIDSVPDNAKVFLDDVLLGVTPLRATGLAAGKHKLEIRYAAGFKAYVANVNLQPGKTLSVSRELQQEPDLEELLLLGKVPRKHTDPATALLWALIPGGGAYYNGYPLQTATLALSMVQSLTMYPAFCRTYAMKRSIDQYSGATDYQALYHYYDMIQSYETSRIMLSLLCAAPLVMYFGSWIDAWVDSTADFSYPTYVGVSSGGGYAFAHVVQTGDTHAADVDAAKLATVTSGYGNGNANFNFGFYMESRRFRIDLDIQYTLPYSYMLKPGYYYRFVLNDIIHVGIGASAYWTIGGSYTNDTPVATLPGMAVIPALLLSTRAGGLEADVYVSPYCALQNLTYHVQDYGVSVSGYSQTAPYMQAAGIWAKVDLRYFFTSSFGLRLVVEGGYLTNISTELQGNGFSTLGTYQFLQAVGGITFRL